MLFTKFANIATLYLLPHASVINNLPEHIDSVNCNNCNKIIIIFYNNVNAHLYMGWGGWGCGGVAGGGGVCGWVHTGSTTPSLPTTTTTTTHGNVPTWTSNFFFIRGWINLNKANVIERGGRIDVSVCFIDIEIEFKKKTKKLELNH